MMNELPPAINENVKPIKRVKKGRFKNTAEMIRTLSGDPKQAKRSVEEMRQRCLLDFLMAQRARQGLTQSDIAASMKCKQSRISKLENGQDNDLNIEDLSGYIEAMGFDLNMFVTKKGDGVVQLVKQHIYTIRRLLDQLVKLAGKDEVIGEGTRNFLDEVIMNSVASVVEASEKLEKNLKAADTGKLLPAMICESPPMIQGGPDESHFGPKVKRSLAGTAGK